MKEFVKEGHGFYSLHNNSHVSLSSRTFRDVMGGAYIGHPPLRPFKVYVVNQTHPITRGIQDFMVNDEQHYVEYDKDRKYVLLESENVDGLTFQNLGNKSVAGWAYDHGRGSSRVHVRGPYHPRVMGARILKTGEAGRPMAAPRNLGPTRFRRVLTDTE